jgi:isopentenyl phosphate kinase
VVFVKWGGSLITDKRQRATPRPDLIRRLARELHAAREANPDLRVVLGHGSGSFGHWVANRYGTQQGVATAEEWRGFAAVGAAAARLNRIVTDACLEAGVPALSLQPSASALAADGEIVRWETDAVARALDRGLVPLVFGDVAFDTEKGGTILSTETLLAHLAHRLRPQRVLLLGNAPGVLDDRRRPIPAITPATYADVAPFLGGSGYVDVTGGMLTKVRQMLTLVEAFPELRVWILTGREPGNLERALLDPAATPGTCICRASATA